MYVNMYVCTLYTIKLQQNYQNCMTNATTHTYLLNYVTAFSPETVPVQLVKERAYRNFGKIDDIFETIVL